MNRLVFFSRRWLTMAALVLVSTLGLSIATDIQVSAASYPTYTYTTDGKFVVSGGQLSQFLTSSSFDASLVSGGNWEAYPTVKSGSTCSNNLAHIQFVANNVTEPGVESIVTEVYVLCDDGNTLEIDSVHYGDMNEYWTDGSQKVIKESSTPPGQPGPVKPPGIEGSELYRFYHEKDANGKYILACVGMFKQFSGIGAPGTELEGCAEFTDNDQSFTWSRTLNVNNPALYACGGAGEKPYKFTITVPNPPTINDVGSVPGTITVEPASSTSNCTDLDLKGAEDGIPIEIMAGDKLDSLGGVEFEAEEPVSECRISGVGWLVCPVVRFMAQVVDKFYSFIASMLEVSPRFFFTEGGSYGPVHEPWSRMQGIANVLFAVAFIFIIYSQLTSAGISNYGIKRMLPKLIIGALLINASYIISAIAVDITNLLGESLYNVLTSTAQNLYPDAPSEDGGGLSGGNPNWDTLALMAMSTAGAIAVGTGLLSISLLLPILVAAFLAIATVAIVLTLRQVLIVGLIIIAPLAFVAYLMPNTEQWFKRWWSTFRTMLLLYPVIAIIFGASAIANQVLNEVAADASGEAGPLAIGPFMWHVMAAGASILPLFITPILMKTTSGVLGQVTGMVNNKERGILDRSKNFARNRQNTRNQATLAGEGRFGTRGKYNPIGLAGRGMNTIRRNRKANLDRLDAVQEANWRGSSGLQVGGKTLAKGGQQTNLALNAAQLELQKVKVDAEIDDLKYNRDLHVNVAAANSDLGLAKAEQTALESELSAGVASGGVSQDIADRMKRAADNTAHLNTRAHSAEDVAEIERAKELASSDELQALASGIAGDPGKLRVKAAAKAEVSKKSMQNIDNIMSTTDYDVASSPERLKTLFEAATTDEERAAYQKLMVRNGSPGVTMARETLKSFTAGKNLNDPDVLALKEILASDEQFKRQGRDFEVWANNEQSATTLDANGNEVKVVHSDFGAVSDDLGVWGSISAQRFASMNQSSQNTMTNLLAKPGNEDQLKGFIRRMVNDSTAMGQIKEGPQEFIIEQSARLGITPGQNANPTPPGPSTPPPDLNIPRNLGS